MKLFVLAVLTVVLSSIGYSQSDSVVLNNANSGKTFYTCDGKFMDSGLDGTGTGTDFFYGNNENDTITICPDRPGYLTRIVFDKFQIFKDDKLFAFDGNSVLATSLGSFEEDGSGGTPDKTPVDTIQASSSNASGCLTFVFKSDGIKTDKGWLGNISCFFPCQAFTVAPLFDGVAASLTPIKVCVGETINLSATGIYPYSAPLFNGQTYSSPPFSQTVYEDSLYHQENKKSEFKWKIDSQNGKPGTKMDTITSYTFDVEGIYHVYVEVKDNHHQQDGIVATEECFNSNYVEQIYWVSTYPDFKDSLMGTDIRAEFQEVCLKDVNQLYGVATPVSSQETCPPANGDPFFIPDTGPTTGNAYSSTAFVQCYAGQTLTSSAMLNSVCLTMEHSSVGDIEITLTCPTGQSVTLMDYIPGNAVLSWMGEPITDDDSYTGKGVTKDYCFDQTAAQTLNDASMGFGDNVEIPAGDFKPYNNGVNNTFAPLVGCDLNGTWTISIKDNRANDNGSLSNWKLNFDPSIIPSAGSNFTPVLTSQHWTNVTGSPISPADLLEDTLNIITTVVGANTYGFSVKDDFGCVYDTTITFTVKPLPNANFSYPKSFACVNDGSVSPTQAGVPSDTYEYDLDPTSPTGLVMGANGLVNTTTSAPGLYTIRCVAKRNGCTDTVRKQLQIRPNPVANAGVDVSICEGGLVTFAGTSDIGTDSVWYENPTPGTILNNNTQYIVSGTFGDPNTEIKKFTYWAELNGCYDSDEREVTVTKFNDATFSYPVNTICNDIQSTLPSSSPLTGRFTTNPKGGLSIDPNTGEIHAFSSEVGIYEIIREYQPNQLCPPAFKSVTIEILPLPDIDAGADVTLCPGTGSGNVVFTATSNTANPPYVWTKNGTPQGNTTDTYSFVAVNTTDQPIVGVVSVTATLGGCKNTDFATYTINPEPNASAGADKSVCEKDPAVAIGGANSSAYGYLWSAAPGTDINTLNSKTISAPTANVTGTPGTYSYILTVTGVNTGCVKTDDVTIVVHPKPKVKAIAYKSVICLGETTDLVGTGASTYQWLNGPATQHYLVTPTTDGQFTFTVTGTDGYGCKNDSVVTITVLKRPEAFLVVDSLIGYAPLFVHLKDSSQNATEVAWNYNDGSPAYSTNNVGITNAVLYKKPGTYNPLIIARNGYCADTVSVQITVRPILNIAFETPNVFTPNDDKANDIWRLTILLNPQNVESISVDIFNRWGEKVANFVDNSVGWDGKLKSGDDAPTGVYFYTSFVRSKDGLEFNGQGFIELFR